MLSDRPLALIICMGVVFGLPEAAEAQEPNAPAVSPESGATRQRPATQQPGAVEVVPRRPDATAVQPRRHCAPQPQCTQGSVAVCTEQGVCQRGSNRPEQACLNYACVAKLQPIAPRLLPKQPLAVTPR